MQHGSQQGSQQESHAGAQQLGSQAGAQQLGSQAGAQQVGSQQSQQLLLREANLARIRSHRLGFLQHGSQQGSQHESHAGAQQLGSQPQVGSQQSLQPLLHPPNRPAEALEALIAKAPQQIAVKRKRCI
ncbi:hypothetical protein Pla175_46300 [Pirellulimonas nuda]|uniref:Uncharacterized protein n=1 Tax=Pirellulimonas nuda TaxID=2528009 RepID=A0A518DI99_9BACT|nr:hypothetical protein Pla175_46300 [Pirellulimonas nuda]